MAFVLDAVSVDYGGKPAVRDVTLSVADGTIAAVVGSNGAGKTTVLRAAAGMVALRSGRVLHDDEDISHLPLYRRARASISLLPEGRELFTGLSVEENLLLGAVAGRKRVSTQAIEERLDLVYQYFPRLLERRTQTSSSMSGGEQQMVALGRVLMGFPRVLLLDEPSVGLAPRIVDEIADVIAAMRDELGLAVLLVEQNVRMALRIASKVYGLRLGALVLEEDIATGPNSDDGVDRIVAAIR